MSWTNVIGQPQAVTLLERAIATERIAPAYLFAGPPGVGKKLTAKDFSRLLLTHNISPEKQALIYQKIRAGNHPDLWWVQPTYTHQGKLISAEEAESLGVKRKSAPQIRIEQIRQLTEFLGRPPLEASRLVVVIEEAQTMAEGAANALLKTLEEPGRATLILLAPSSESLLPTLVSRCQRIPFYRLGLEGLKQVLAQGYCQQILEDEAVLALAQGSPGEALSGWEQRQIIPSELLEKLLIFPKNAAAALLLAKEIDRTLTSETQSWLLDYLQYHYWQNFLQQKISISPLTYLEKTRKALFAYAQPRLAWECLLLELTLNSSK